MIVPDGFHPSRRLGQNFLQDKTIVDRIVDSASIQRNERILEIGAGFGALTRSLAALPEAPPLTAVEVDRRLGEILGRDLEHLSNVKIITANILSADPSSLLEEDAKRVVISNAPYSISGALMRWLMSAAPRMARAIVMLQREVADRMWASPGSKDYSVLTLLTNYYFRVDRLFTVHPGAFWPRPKVDSVVLRLIPHRTAPVDVLSEKTFVQLIKAGFANRRKTLRNSLRVAVSSSTEMSEIIDLSLEQAQIDPGIRGESLSMRDYARLANSFSALQRKKR